MQTNLSEIQNYLKDKQICLLGNARSILNNPKDIDNYEIIIRMNRGIPKGKEKYIGSRTDILCTSTKNSFYEIEEFFADYIIWMTKDQKLVTEYINNNAIQNPPEDWQKLKDLYPIDKLPSTGAIVINFLKKHIDFKSLTIYGFDHFKTGTHYHNLQNQQWHPGDLEEKIIKNILYVLPKQNIEWIYEC